MHELSCKACASATRLAIRKNKKFHEQLQIFQPKLLHTVMCSIQNLQPAQYSLLWLAHVVVEGFGRNLELDVMELSIMDLNLSNNTQPA